MNFFLVLQFPCQLTEDVDDVILVLYPENKSYLEVTIKKRSCESIGTRKKANSQERCRICQAFKIWQNGSLATESVNALF